MTKKWVKVNDLSDGQYSINKNLRFKISMLRSDLCDYSDAYFVVKGTTTVEGTNDAIKEIKSSLSRIMHRLDNSYKKLKTMKKILKLLCQCIIC